MSHEAILPKPEMRGVGKVTYRCASCGGAVERPVLFDGERILADVNSASLRPNDLTYHPEHLPEGVNDGR